MAKKAVLIGINYPGTAVELRGCVNDVRRMQKCLIELYGFANKDITILIDTDKSCIQPTGKNIHDELTRLIASGQSGDFLVFHYSGHGTRIPPGIGELGDSTGFDECITPCDMNLIKGMRSKVILFFFFVLDGFEVFFVLLKCLFVRLHTHSSKQNSWLKHSPLATQRKQSSLFLDRNFDLY